MALARMENQTSPPRSFTRSVLPWTVAVAALGLYLATLAGWVTLPALNLTAHILGWDWWNPKIGRPLYHLLTLPVKVLPAGAQITALNAFAALCSALTLALLTVPVVIVSTEEALAAVPRSMREGSLACGASKWQTIWHQVLPMAMPGVLTGLILALSRSIGETAPLITIGALTYIPFAPDSVWSKFTVLPMIDPYTTELWTSTAALGALS